MGYLGSKANDRQLIKPFLDIQFESIHFSYPFELSHSALVLVIRVAIESNKERHFQLT